MKITDYKPHPLSPAYDFVISRDRIIVVVPSLGMTRTFTRDIPQDDPKGGDFYNYNFAQRIVRELGIYMGVDEAGEGVLIREALNCLTITKQDHAGNVEPRLSQVG